MSVTRLSMRLSNYAYIVSGNLLERKGRTLLAILMVAFAIFILCLVVGLSRGFLGGVIAQAEKVFPPTLLTAKPKTVSLAMLSFNAGMLDQTALDYVRTVKGVEKAEPQLSLKVPLRMEIEIANQTGVTDAVVIGVEEDSMTEFIAPGKSFSYDESTSMPMPCILPRFLLEMYNLAYADSIGLPKISETYIIGMKFNLIIGETYLMGAPTGKSVSIPCQVVGLGSDSSLVAGVYIPLDHAKRINELYSNKKLVEYSAMRITVKDTDHLPAVMEELKKMNLMVEGNKDTYDNIKSSVRMAGSVILGLGAAVALISAVSLFNVFSVIFLERRGEIALARAIGGTRRAVLSMFSTEALVIGLLGAGLALTGYFLSADKINTAFLTYFPPIDFLPEKVLTLATIDVISLMVFACGLPVAAALLSYRSGKNLAAAA